MVYFIKQSNLSSFNAPNTLSYFFVMYCGYRGINEPYRVMRRPHNLALGIVESSALFGVVFLPTGGPARWKPSLRATISLIISFAPP